MSQPSGFDTFSSDYDKVNHIDTDTFSKRKLYDQTPYLILPGNKFFMRLGDNKPDFKCFVKKCGEQFGDPITLPALDTYAIKLMVYDSANNLITVGNMTVSDLSLGEISYTFTGMDFSVAGVYYAQVQFTLSGDTFTLPTTNLKCEIIIKN